MSPKPRPKPITWDTRRYADLAKDLDVLISDLCRNWGFCNQLTGADLLAANEVIDGEYLARSVIVAEGGRPDKLMGWQLDIAKQFRKRYGASVSIASHARTNVR